MSEEKETEEEITRKLHRCPCCHVVSSYLEVPGDQTLGHPEYKKWQEKKSKEWEGRKPFLDNGTGV